MRCFKINLIVVFIICMFSNAYCFDDQKTHPDITERAIARSNLNNYLINSLGFKEGTKTELRGYNFLGWPIEKEILEWIRKGSTDEDDPTCRAANHFHDPLKAWTDSYVTDSPAIIQAWCRDTAPVWPQYSNITWATGYNIVC